MKRLLLDAKDEETLAAVLAYAYRCNLLPKDELRDLHSRVVSLADDNVKYLKPNYPVPATCELHMSPELMDHWTKYIE